MIGFAMQGNASRSFAWVDENRQAQLKPVCLPGGQGFDGLRTKLCCCPL